MPTVQLREPTVLIRALWAEETQKYTDNKNVISVNKYVLNMKYQ